MIGYWAFNEGSGTTAIDSSGNGNNGTFGTSSYTTGQSGAAGDYALNDVGTGQAVSVPAAGQFDDIGTNNQVTLSLWMYGDPVLQPRNNTTVSGMNGRNRIIFTHLPYGGGRIYWDSGNVTCCPGSMRLSYVESDPNNYEGRWNHYALVKDGTTDFSGVYVNGTLAASTNSSTADLAGMTSLVLSPNFRGYDDIAIYSDALSADTILAMATGQLADGKTYTGLVGSNAYTKLVPVLPLLRTTCTPVQPSSTPARWSSTRPTSIPTPAPAFSSTTARPSRLRSRAASLATISEPPGPSMPTAAARSRLGPA